jgi:hypothetical protein
MHGDGESLARPLGGGEVGPVELPPARLAPPRSTRTQWYGLVAFALFGVTSILIGSGLHELSGAATHAKLPWERMAELEVPITDGPPTSTIVYAVSVDGLPAVGKADAKVTLVAITDYACLGCERARTLLHSLRGSYGDDLRIVFKPKQATPAAAAACAAGLQGEFERFDEALWRASIDRTGGAEVAIPQPDAATPGCAGAMGGCKALSRIARDQGLDMSRFGSAIKRCAATVWASEAELEVLRVSSPTFFVNGRMVDPWGIEHAGTFQSLIDVELAKARRRIAAGASQERYYQQWVIDVGQTAR